jgi:hypothetical protein
LSLAIAGALCLPTIALGKSPAHTPASSEVSVTRTARQMAAWVLASNDNDSLPFLIVDKSGAKAFTFDGRGQLLGAAWVLVGLAKGDDTVPGIGTMPLSAIKPSMRTTPAGRFVAVLGHDLETQVLWVDYDTATSLHPVINTDPAERRLQRIASPKPAEHRISFGCINVPARFFSDVVEPAFRNGKGIVYILPDVKPLEVVFPNYRAEDDPADFAPASAGSETAN